MKKKDILIEHLLRHPTPDAVFLYQKMRKSEVKPKKSTEKKLATGNKS